MAHWGPRGGVAALGLGAAALLVIGHPPGHTGDTGRQLAAVLASSTLGAAAVLWVLFDKRFGHSTPGTLAQVMVLALVLRGVSLLAWPLLEDDHYRYLWDGLRTLTALDPYRQPPEAFFGDSSMPPQWQAVLNGINNPGVPTLYGPVLQGLFALGHAIAPARVGALQGLLLAVDMTVLGVLAWRQVDVRALWIYALHPLVLKETVASAHPDALLAIWALLAVVAWQRRQPTWLGVLMGLAVCTKVAALVMLPFILWPPGRGDGRRVFCWGWAARVGAAFVACVAALYAPFLIVGGSELQGLLTFGREWRFNPLGFRVVEAIVPAGMARLAAGGLIVVGIALLLWRWLWPSHALASLRLPPLDNALWLLLLLSPVVNPWYGLWALAVSLHRGQAWPAVALLAAPLAYLNATVLAEAGLPWADGAGPYAVVWPAVMVQAVAWTAAWHWRARFELIAGTPSFGRPVQTSAA